jgi:hypothetical protein
MTDSILSDILFNPPVLCFFMGAAACLLKSDLEFPKPLPKLFSLYLLFAIGFKGGIGLYHSGISAEAVKTLGLCLLLSVAVPFYAYHLARRRLSSANAAAVAATYGSISAVTFITATVFLDKAGISYGSYMVAAMALMESPAIVIGVLLARYYADREASSTNRMPWKEILRDAFFNGSVVLLVGAMGIGWITGERGYSMLKPFTHDLFYGMLCLFLIDMGIVSARRIGDMKEVGLPLLAYALLLPLLNASVATLLVLLFGLPLGTGFLVVVLAASASYIAVPAAMRLAVPQSNAGIYLTMALAITFPFNIVVGLPLYFYVIKSLGL